MTPAELEALRQYLTETRRHALGQAKACEVLLSKLGADKPQPQPMNGKNETATPAPVYNQAQ